MGELLFDFFNLSGPLQFEEHSLLIAADLDLCSPSFWVHSEFTSWATVQGNWWYVLIVFCQESQDYCNWPMTDDAINFD